MRTLIRRHLLVILSSVVAISSQLAHAAPNQPFPIGSINCDEAMRASVIGDSIVTGAGDSVNGQRGGYVKRLNQHYSGISFHAYGKYGYTTAQILAYIRSTLRSRSAYGRRLRNSDIIIIDAGRNDWKTHRDPSRTVATLRSLVRVIRRFSDAEVFVGTNIPTLRSGQEDLVKRINRALVRASSTALPVRIRFDRLPSTVLSSDDIHPSSEGYDAIAEFLIDYFSGKFLEDIESRTADTNEDGVTDWCEAQGL